MTTTHIRPTATRGSRPYPTGRSALAATAGANALRLDPYPADVDYPVDLVDRVDLVAPDAPPWAPAEAPDRSSTRTGTAIAPPAPAPVAVPRASFVAVVLGLVVTGVLGVLVINTRINENAFRLDDLHQRQAALDLQEQQLSGQLADLESPGNLAAAARRLGLVPAGTPAYIRLPDGRVLGVPQPATGTASASANSAGQ